MYNRLKVYETWAPYGVIWSQWAKPVMFSTQGYATNFEAANVSWINNVDNKTMIIVDLEGENSVREGVAYAKIGYRPVPLFNGVRAKYGDSIIDVVKLQNNLFTASSELSNCIIAKDAPPAFLLDSRRMSSDKRKGVFDNRWLVFPQDMPSASFLKRNGIEKIVVRASRILDDLSHILLRYQKEGLVVYICNNTNDIPSKIKIRKPSKFKSLRYRFSVMLGLKRNSTGGFGSFIPETSDMGYRGVG